MVSAEFCLSCGAPLREGAAFCGECGYAFEPTATARAPSAAPPAAADPRPPPAEPTPAELAPATGPSEVPLPAATDHVPPRQTRTRWFLAGALVVAVIAIVAVLAVVLAGGGDDASEQPPAAGGGKRSSAAALDPSQIEAALLGREELEAVNPALTWSSTEEGPVGPSSDEGFCNGPTTTSLARSAGDAASGWVAYRQTDPPGSSVLLKELIDSYPTTAKADRFMSSVRDSIACKSYDTAFLTIELQRSSSPKLGDDSFVIRETSTSRSVPEAAPMLYHYLFVRKGSEIVTLELGGSSGNPDALRTFGKVALDKVDVAVGRG